MTSQPNPVTWMRLGRITALTTVLAAGISTSGFAGVNVWTTHGPEGGGVESLAVNPVQPSTVYAGSVYGGLFKSTDGGGSWSPADNGLARPDINGASITEIRALAIDPASPDTIYAGTVDGPFKSTNGAVSWSPINAGMPFSPAVNAFWIDPSSPLTAYAGTGDGVFKSVNSGMSWSASGLSGLEVRHLAANATAPGTLYAGTAFDGIFKSINGGASWNPANNGFANLMVTSILIDRTSSATIYAGTEGGLYKSMDAGASWTFSGAGINTVVIALAQAAGSGPGASPIYAATLGAGVYESTDGAANWFPVNSGLSDTVIYAMTADPTTPQTLYVGVQFRGVFKTTDGGLNWVPRKGNLIATQTFALAVDPLNPDTVYVGAEGVYAGIGVWKSMNGGTTWSPANSGLFDYTYALAIDPVTPTTLYAGTFSGVYKTVNAGGDWSPARDGMGTIYIHALAVDPQMPSTVYASTDNQIFKTTDGGANWISTGSRLLGIRVFGLVIDPSSSATIYAATDGGGVLKSTDAGQTWNPASTGISTSHITALAIDPSSPGTLYAGSGDFGGTLLYKTTSAAASWSPSDAGLPGGVTALAINPADPSRLYAGVFQGGVFTSSDGGATWSPFRSGLNDPGSLTISALAVSATGKSVHAATPGRGVFDLTVARYDLYTITPCRVADTRDSAGPSLSAGQTRVFSVAGHCGIPPTAGAVAFNFTITQPTGDGHLTVFPGGAIPPATSTINYRAGQTRANNAIGMLGTAGDISASCAQSQGIVHLIIDVTGYFQ